MKSPKAPTFVVTVQGNSMLKLIISLVLLLFLVFSLSALFTALSPEYRIKSHSLGSASTILNGEVLYKLMGSENHSLLQALPNDSTPNFSSLLFKASTNINLDDPRSLLGREFPGFSLFDGDILVAGEGTNYTNMPMESPPPQEVLNIEQEAKLQNTKELESGKASETTSPPLSTGKRKVVYIYFSHNRESFLPYLKGVTDPNLAHHSKINVTKIGDRLKSQFESNGIGTVVEKADIMDKLNKKGWTYGRSYDESRNVVQAAMTKNEDLTYFIDIHRDSRRKKDTTKKINGKSYAKLAFVIGAEHSKYEKNLKLANKIHKKLEKKYPGLSRGIIQKKGAHTNGKFNQDLSEKAMLVEFGGVDNTFEELNRSADAFVDVLSEIFWDAEEVSNTVENNGDEK